MTAALHARQVTVRFASHQALAGIDLRIAPGERVALVGANGAGKTTLFDVLGGQLPPTAGRVELYGVDVTGWSPTRRARAGLGRTFQHLGLVPSLSVRDNLHLGIDARRGRTTIEVALAHANLADKAEAAIHALSRAEQRRLAVVRSLLGAPKLLLLDEPGAGLSPRDKTALLGLVDALAPEAGVLLVEHDLEVVLAFCPRAVVLDDGQVRSDGLSTDLQSGLHEAGGEP